MAVYSIGISDYSVVASLLANFQYDKRFIVTLKIYNYVLLNILQLLPFSYEIDANLNISSQRTFFLVLPLASLI